MARTSIWPSLMLSPTPIKTNFSGLRRPAAMSFASRVLKGMADSAAADTARAAGLAAQALAASPRSQLAHFARGLALRAQRRFEDAIPELEAVLASDRNWVDALNPLAECKLFAGLMEEATPLVEQAIRLSPRDPQLDGWYFTIARVHLLQSRTDEAIVWLEKARNANPGHPHVHAWLASAHALKGATERAASELAEACKLNRDDRFSNIARLKTVGFGVPKIRALYEATYFAGLRKAGMPDE